MLRSHVGYTSAAVPNRFLFRSCAVKNDTKYDTAVGRTRSASQRTAQKSTSFRIALVEDGTENGRSFFLLVLYGKEYGTGGVNTIEYGTENGFDDL